MQYEFVSDEEFIDNLENRMRQYEREHLDHELNKKAVATLPESDPAKKKATEDADKAQAILDKAYGAVKADRDARKKNK